MVRKRGNLARRAFSLIELVIVVVIIGIIAAIAVPRMSRGASGAGDSALAGDLATLRNAIDLYQTEHGGTYPTDETTITNQLTQFTDDAGVAVAVQDSTHIYGTYIRSIPTLPVGARKTQSGIGNADGPTIGWIYDKTAHTIKANTSATEKDARGVLYSSY
jgi:prepilin-type N-terminal cleavage/methylation domain-containing protein